MTTTPAPRTDRTVTVGEVLSKSNFEETGREHEKASRGARGTSIINRSYSACQRWARVAWSQWWLWTTQPMTFRAAWQTAKPADIRRVPARSRVLLEAWRWDDRLGSGLLVFLLAALLQGLAACLLWLRATPARRLGALAAALAVVVAWKIAGAR